MSRLWLLVALLLLACRSPGIKRALPPSEECKLNGARLGLSESQLRELWGEPDLRNAENRRVALHYNAKVVGAGTPLHNPWQNEPELRNVGFGIASLKNDRVTQLIGTVLEVPDIGPVHAGMTDEQLVKVLGPPDLRYEQRDVIYDQPAVVFFLREGVVDNIRLRPSRPSRSLIKVVDSAFTTERPNVVKKYGLFTEGDQIWHRFKVTGLPSSSGGELRLELVVENSRDQEVFVRDEVLTYEGSDLSVVTQVKLPKDTWHQRYGLHAVLYHKATNARIAHNATFATVTEDVTFKVSNVHFSDDKRPAVPKQEFAAGDLIRIESTVEGLVQEKLGRQVLLYQGLFVYDPTGHLRSLDQVTMGNKDDRTNTRQVTSTKIGTRHDDPKGRYEVLLFTGDGETKTAEERVLEFWLK